MSHYDMTDPRTWEMKCHYCGTSADVSEMFNCDTCEEVICDSCLVSFDDDGSVDLSDFCETCWEKFKAKKHQPNTAGEC